MLHLFGNGYWWRSTQISKDGRSGFDAHGFLHSPDPFESNYEVEWQWDWAGFTFGAEQFRPGVMPLHRLEIYAIPYWSIVIPLALLSAYLILWKPRKVGAGQKCEPSVPETTQQSLTDFRRK